MNTHEIERIAAAMNQLRPDWPTSSLRTLITKSLADRPRRDVAVALAWIACESGTATPARVLEAGPWWKAAAVETGASGHHHVAKVYGWNEGDPRDVCGICGLDQAACLQRARTNGHDFTARIDCLPPTPGFLFGSRAEHCGAQVVEGSVCRLSHGHTGDHNMARTPADSTPTTTNGDAA